MNIPLWMGYWLFFLVPIALWFIVAFFLRQETWADKFLAFLVSNDNRLSLSRLQAFAWTMVIFGSFFAAMAVHSPIPLVNDADVQKAKAEAEFKEQDKETAKVRLDTATKNSAAANTPENQSELQLARTNFEEKSKEALVAQLNAKGNHWVEIPAALLALAGISIGSGILSSFISAVNTEPQTPSISSVAPIAADHVSKVMPEAPETSKQNLVVIQGENLGDGSRGEVRLGSGPVTTEYAHVVHWQKDGKQLLVEMPRTSYDTLVVDTPNGKLSYNMKFNRGETINSLDTAKNYYEFADLFRDDKNPSKLDFMKFQMFGWTLVSIVIYSWLFIGNLNNGVSSLPLVPESIVLLTGLSQAGYLAGKGVSNITPKSNS